MDNNAGAGIMDAVSHQLMDLNGTNTWTLQELSHPGVQASAGRKTG